MAAIPIFGLQKNGTTAIGRRPTVIGQTKLQPDCRVRQSTHGFQVTIELLL